VKEQGTGEVCKKTKNNNRSAKQRETERPTTKTCPTRASLYFHPYNFFFSNVGWRQRTKKKQKKKRGKMVLLKLFRSNNNNKRVLFGKALKEGTQLLAQRLSLSPEEASLEARLLLQHAAQLTRTQLFLLLSASSSSSSPPSSSVSVSRDVLDKFERNLSRRCGWEPVAYIVKEKEFWSLPFHVNHNVLIPRPDSETLVEAVTLWTTQQQQQQLTKDSMIEKGRESEVGVLDLGVGSGCLLLSILHELKKNNNNYSNNLRKVFGVGVDMSEGALLVAQRNAERLGLSDSVRFLRGSWTSPLFSSAPFFPPFPSPKDNSREEWLGRFDVIVSNPPYLSTEELKHLSPSVLRFEPRSALEPSNDSDYEQPRKKEEKNGLEGYLGIAQSKPEIWKLLKPEGVLALEVGWQQAQDVKTLFHRHTPLRHLQTFKDLNGIDRCLLFKHFPEHQQ
jgi:release factor glutamine methyltransferase